MPKFRKDILKIGRYTAPEGELFVTSEKMNHWVKSSRDMKKAGLKIPVPWGHTDRAKPKTLEEREYWESKYNAGFLDSLEVNGDTLSAIIDVPLTADAERVGTIVQEVSPQIEMHWRDGTGRTWDNVITHLALVTQPVVPNQSNFVPYTDDPIQPGTARFSLKNYITPNTVGDDKKMAEEKKKVDNKSLLEALSAVGLELPSDAESADDDKFKDMLLSAALTLKAALDKYESEHAEPAQTPEGAEGSLSDDDYKALEEELSKMEKPEDKQDMAAKPQETAPAALPEKEEPVTMTMRNKVNYLEKELEESHRSNLIRDIDNLLVTGRITPTMAEGLKNQVKLYKLSLRDDGTREESIVQNQVAMLQLLPEHACWVNTDKVNLRNVAEAALPQTFDSNMNPELADKIANQMVKLKIN